MSRAWLTDPYHPVYDAFPAKKKRSRKCRSKHNWRERLLREYEDGLIVCCHCGRKLTGKKDYVDRSPGGVTIDHIIPLSVGGANSFDNLALSCAECNVRKGNKIRTPSFGPRKNWPGRKKGHKGI